MDMRVGVAALVAGALVLGLVGPPGAASQASQGDQQARIHFEAGRLHYDQGRFDEAAREFGLAHELSGNPALLYNLFLVYRDSNQTERAVQALEGYLEQVPDQPNRAGLMARLEAMKRRLAAEKGGTPSGEARPADGASAEPDDPPSPATDGAGASPSLETPTTDPSEGGGVPAGAIATMAAGGALVLGAVITGVMAKGAESDFHDGCPTRTACDPALEGTRDRARRLGLITDVLWITGAVAAVGGLVWLLLGRGSSDEAPEPPVAFGCGPGGCGVAYEGKF
jgi:tetratricopeptide (TPR) repeat protein